jgi:hypothetical protein
MIELELQAIKQAAERVLGRPLALPTPAPVLPRLLAAKAESDRRNYAAKHALIRQLLRERPDDFFVDSESGGILGLTHQPSGFRMHVPARIVPRPELVRRVLQLPRPV